MSAKHTLSLPAAIMINVNIMLGAGIFINTTALAQRAGMLGALGYVIVGLLMTPLILSIAQLLRMHPGGGFYLFGKQEMNAFAGFLSAWSYFVAKLASATLMIHTSILLIGSIIPMIGQCNPLMLDTIILTLFAALNMCNIRTGSLVQTVFMVLKIIPIAFAIMVGLWLFDGANMTPQHLVWSGIPSMLSLVLYACVGFEAAVSLSSKIENPEKNAPKAILISYALVICIAALYQFAFYGAVGNMLQLAPNYLHAFPTLLAMGHFNVASWQTLMHLAIASSALGGAYGILFSNSWNLYSLAEHNHLIGSRFFRQKNAHHIPWLCVLAEVVLCLIYLSITRGEKVLLQQVSGLGVVFAYFMSVLSLVFAKRNNPQLNVKWIIPIFGLCNALLLMGMCVHGLFYAGSTSLLAFLILFGSGAGMFFTTNK